MSDHDTDGASGGGNAAQTAGRSDADPEQRTGSTPHSPGTTATADDRPVTELLQHPVTKRYVKYSVGVYLAFGLAVGTTAILIGTFTDPVVFDEAVTGDLAEEVGTGFGDASDEIEAELETFVESQYATTVSGFLLFSTIPLSLLLAVGVGALVSSRLSQFRPAATASAASAFAGTVVAIVVAGSLASTQFEAPSETLQEGPFGIDFILFFDTGPLMGYELQYGDLITLAVFVGIGAVVAAVGTAYVVHAVSLPEEFPEQ